MTDPERSSSNSESDSNLKSNSESNVGSNSESESESNSSRQSPASSGDRPALADQRDIETQVYQPAEDSRLLAETVLASTALASGDRVLDVGTGSGFVARHLGRETGATVIGSDINRLACRQAKTARIQTVQANLLDPFRADSFDMVVCNPPYLPTSPEQEWNDPVESALSGGPDGRSVIDPFLADVPRVLVPTGRAYLLVSTLTDPDIVREHAVDAGLGSTVVAEESHPFEKLLVLELSPSEQQS